MPRMKLGENTDTYTVLAPVSIVDFRRVRQELKDTINGMYIIIEILVMNLISIGKGDLN